MTLLALLWWTSLALAAIALAWMAGLIVARLFRENDEARRAADRQTLARAYLAIMSGEGDAGGMLKPFRGRARLMAETLLEVLGLVRGADRERLVESLHGHGVDARLRLRLHRGSLTGRLAAAEALSAFPSPESRAALEDVLARSHETDLRIAAVRALIAIGAAPTPEALIADLERRREADSLLYTPLFGRLATEAPDAMIAAFTDQSTRSSTRAAVAEALGASGDYRAIQALVSQAEAPDPVLRAAVVRALGALAHPAGAGAVMQAFTDEALDVRADACVAAGRIGLPTFAEPLTRALSDDAWWVRFRAAEALAGLGGLGQAALRIAATSPIDVTRRSASLALAERGLV